MAQRKRPRPTSHTPLMRQYRAIKQQYPDCILFFRLGDFYEMFYDDAVVASRELDLVLTTRDRDRPDPVPMCGIPWFAADGYIARLIRKGYKIALCEQVEDPAQARGLVKRAVVRVITPGTYVSSEDEPVHSRLCALAQIRDRFGMAWYDMITGTLAATEWNHADGARRVTELWPQIMATEILYPESWRTETVNRVRGWGLDAGTWTPVPDWVYDDAYARQICQRVLQVESLQAYDLEDHAAARMATGALLHYLEETQQTHQHAIQQVTFRHPGDRVVLDATTVRNLELVQNAADGTTRGTLLWALDRTRTAMGRRLLRNWILAPRTRIEEIEPRLDAIAGLVQRPEAIAALQDRLTGLPDLDRITTRLSLGTAGPRDLAALRDALTRLPELWTTLRTATPQGILQPVAARADLLEDLADLYRSALVAEPPALARDGGFIRDGFDVELDEARSIARDSKQWIARLEQRERQRTGIANLRIGYNRVFGYYIEVTKAHLNRIPADYERRQTLTQAERFVTPELKELEAKILSAEERAREREQRLFADLVQRGQARLDELRALAQDLARLDVVVSLADVALRHRYCRPTLDHSDIIAIRNGRHPVLERLQTERPFIPNDTYMDQKEAQILILTGPNMGGKSTYLRQVALICLMAQMGSFVPAEHARLGVVDRIFTRVGAADFLTRGQSTFMVEMLETAFILHHATPRSLVVLDEIGRGTSTFDGMALAWAVLEYLHEHWTPGPRTLFATHFHELVHLAELYPRIQNFSVAVKETGPDIVFLYRVVPGPSDQSYGVHVARLAGVPRPVLDRARAILKQLEDLEKTLEQTIGRTSGRSIGPTPLLTAQRQTRAQLPRLVQRSLFEMDPRFQTWDQMVREILEIDLDHWSPVQAWQYLYRLQRILRGESPDADESS